MEVLFQNLRIVAAVWLFYANELSFRESRNISSVFKFRQFDEFYVCIISLRVHVEIDTHT